MYTRFLWDFSTMTLTMPYITKKYSWYKRSYGLWKRVDENFVIFLWKTKLMSEYAMNSVIRVLTALLMMTPVLAFRPIRTGIAWRKYEYRNLAFYEKNDKESIQNEQIEDEFYKKICKQVDRWRFWLLTEKNDLLQVLVPHLPCPQVNLSL